MKTRNSGNTHSIHFRKLAKPVVLSIIAIFVISMLSVFVSTGAPASITPALHTSGDQILDSNNNVVILRGIGRTGDLESASGMWSGPGMAVADWSQKWQSISSNIPLMDATFRCYRQSWGVNMIRILIPVNWWWQNNVVPSQYQSGAPSSTISYRTYIETLVQVAAKYGIYVDFCPYDVFDAYTDSSGTNSNGMPGSLSISAYNYMLSINSAGEMPAWNTWWTSVATSLNHYSNVIFEAWNEPQDTGNDAVISSYMSYLTTMYSAIRDSGSENLIFMQWDGGYVPTFNTLSWCSQISAAIPNSLNLAFTTHCYIYSPYFNSEWGTSNSTVLSQLQAAVQSMGVNAPLVINEAGSCMSVVASSDVQDELNWWTGLNYAAKELGIGVCAYYWIYKYDLGPVFDGEALLTGIWARARSLPHQMLLAKSS